MFGKKKDTPSTLLTQKHLMEFLRLWTRLVYFVDEIKSEWTPDKHEPLLFDVTFNVDYKRIGYIRPGTLERFVSLDVKDRVQPGDVTHDFKPVPEDQLGRLARIEWNVWRPVANIRRFFA
jgi:hypothetical protein